MRASCSAVHGVVPPLQPSPVVPVTSATLPAPAAIGIGLGSVKSGPGRAAPLAPGAMPTRKYPPGGTLTFGSSVSCVDDEPRLPVPADEVYWIDRPFSEAALAPRL